MTDRDIKPENVTGDPYRTPGEVVTVEERRWRLFEQLRALYATNVCWWTKQQHDELQRRIDAVLAKITALR